jgi:hypothetical protein
MEPRYAFVEDEDLVGGVASDFGALLLDRVERVLWPFALLDDQLELLTAGGLHLAGLAGAALVLRL